MNYLLILPLLYGSTMGAAAAAAAMPAVERKVKREIVPAAPSIARWQRIAACDKVALAKFLDAKLNATKGIVFDYLEGDNPDPLWQIIDSTGDPIVDLAFSIGPDYVHKRSKDDLLHQSYDLATGQELYRYQLPNDGNAISRLRSKFVLVHLPNGRIIMGDRKRNKKKEYDEHHFKSFIAPRKAGLISWFKGVETAERILPDRSLLQVFSYADNNELIVDNGEHTLMLDASTLQTKGIFGTCEPRNADDPLDAARIRSCWKLGDDFFLARSNLLHFYKLPENYGAPHRTFDWNGKGMPYQIMKLAGNKFLIMSIPSARLQVANVNDGSVASLPASSDRITHIQNDEFLSLSYEKIHYWDLNRSWSPIRTFIDAQKRHIRGVFVRPDRSFIGVYCGGEVEVAKFHLDNDTRVIIKPAGDEPEYIREVCMNVNGDLMCRSDREVQCLSLKSDVQLAYEAGKIKVNALLAIQAAKDAKKKKPAAAAAAR